MYLHVYNVFGNHYLRSESEEDTKILNKSILDIKEITRVKIMEEVPLQKEKKRINRSERDGV